jgi:hypothetical protein
MAKKLFCQNKNPLKKADFVRTYFKKIYSKFPKTREKRQEQ